MKKVIFSAVAVLALVSCSNDSLVSDSPANEAPIAFNVGQKNITRATFESVQRYNFGVWAYKTDGTTPLNVMNHYLVGYANGSVGYEKSSVTTGTWFYEGLGKDEYSSSKTGLEATSSSANSKQFLRYWDYSYANTIFYAYAPYNSAVKSNEIYKIEVPSDVNKGGTTTESEFVYAGNNVAKTSYGSPVSLPFKHLGAKVNLKFYEDIAGYKVQLIDVKDANSGIQLTPASYDENATPKYNNANLYTAYDAVIDFSSDASAPSVGIKNGTTPTVSNKNIVFTAPTGDLTTSSDNAVASSTTYYAVAQPATSNTGFTLHVSFKLIAEDNNEVITVHDARVFVPATMVRWASNKAYTYTFKITTNANGSTDPTNPEIDPTKPDVPATNALHPIVFENITIEDYTEVSNAKDI